MRDAPEAIRLPFNLRPRSVAARQTRDTDPRRATLFANIVSVSKDVQECLRNRQTTAASRGCGEESAGARLSGAGRTSVFGNRTLSARRLGRLDMGRLLPEEGPV